jgi:hypothetical protein
VGEEAGASPVQTERASALMLRAAPVTRPETRAGRDTEVVDRRRIAAAIWPSPNVDAVTDRQDDPGPRLTRSGKL